MKYVQFPTMKTQLFSLNKFPNCRVRLLQSEAPEATHFRLAGFWKKTEVNDHGSKISYPVYEAVILHDPEFVSLDGRDGIKRKDLIYMKVTTVPCFFPDVESDITTAYLATQGEVEAENNKMDL